MCTRFPGMQPVSLNQDNCKALLSDDYYVCEKSDGIRILCFATSSQAQNQSFHMPPTVYICDRNYLFRALPGFFWPFASDGSLLHSQTLLDGELVLDTNPYTQEKVLRLNRYILSVFLLISYYVAFRS